MIHITDKQTDDIIGFFTHKNVTFNEQIQNLETYQDDFEFTTFGDHKYADTLTDMNRVITPAEDGGYSEYVINTVRKSRNRSNKVRVKSFASYQMLTVAKVIEPTTLSAYTPSQALGFITNDTEWRPGIVESNASRTFHIENYTDRLSFLKTVANEFDLEIRFRIETDGRRVTGRFIDLLEQVGEWRGREITFGKDLESIERTEDLENIVTKLICLGPEDENGNRLKIEVSDDDALRRWGRPHPITGELMHLEDTYEPTSERTDMTEVELRQYGRTELNKRINSIVTYEAEVVDLENAPGMANKKIRFGDTVRIKDEKFNPPLYVEARIFEQRRDIFTKSNKRVKLGDFIEYTEDELRAVIDRLSKQLRSKISQAQLVEHTYSKIEIDQKDQYVFDEGKTFAEAVGITAEDNAKQFATDQDSALKIDVEGYADQAADQAKDNAKVYADDVSAQALQQALAESVAKDTYDAKMAQIASDLGDKAGITYVDGKLQIVDGRINDLDAEIETKADGSTVYTISEVDNMINNTVSVTQYQTDINGIVTDSSNQSTQIGQNTEAIGLKADQTTVNALTGTVNSHSAQLLTMADEISAKVSADYVQTAIDDIEIGGRNLIRNSDFTDGTNHWSGDGSIVEDGYFSNYGMELSSVVGRSDIVQSTARLDKGDYVISIWIKWVDGQVPYLFSDSNINLKGGFTDRNVFDDLEIGIWKKVTIPFEATSDNAQFYGIRYASGAPTKHLEGTVIIGGMKLEKGNKATDWTPAPEDIDAEISSLSAELSVQAGIISAKADSSTVTAIGNRVSTAETKISGLEGEITSKVSTTQFNTLSGTVSTLSTTVTQTAQDVQFAFDEIDDMGNKINNAVVTMDGNGVTVADGSFYLKDGDMKYNVVTKRNLIRDHSFERIVRAGGNVASDGTIAVGSGGVGAGSWGLSGSPRMMTAWSTGFLASMYGYQSAVVNSTNYLYQDVSFYVGAGRTYTISADFFLSARSSSATPRLRVRMTRGSSGAAAQTWNQTFPILSGSNSGQRHSMTFTIPNNAIIGAGANEVIVDIISNNSNWVAVDGVQLVEGTAPSIYYPEDEAYLLKGEPGAQEYFADGAIFDGDLTLWNNRMVRSTTNYLNLRAEQGSILLQTDDDVRAVGVGSSNSNWRPFRAGSLRTTSAGNADGDLILNDAGRVHNSGDGRTFIQGNTEVRATRYMSATLVPMVAQAFNTSSSRKLKTNIETYENSALDIINDLTIVNYDWISDLEDGITDNRQIGVISEDSPHIATKSGDAIKINDLVMYLAKAIQELCQVYKIELVTETGELKTENQLLKNELKIIKERIT